jgi:L-cystine uptake protein TcyP (sodium:dicarboxylate symporter family)
MNRGQISIEILFLLLIIISFSAFVGTLILQTQDITNAYSLIKTELIEQNNLKEGEVWIEEISFNSSSESFEVKTIPNNFINEDFDLEKIKEKLSKLNSLSNPTIQIN